MKVYMPTEEEKKYPAHPISLSFVEEEELIWGRRWGAQSEVGKLRVALVNRPGLEFDHEDIFRYPSWYDIHEKTNRVKAQEQHDDLVKILREANVEVYYLKRPDLIHGPYSPANPRVWATRDPGIVINGGAIVGRMSLPWRKKDEYYWAITVMELGIPILYTVNGYGTFEGGNVVWLDPEHVVIGQSIRTNEEGIRQVSHILREIGEVKEIKIAPLPGYLFNLEWPAGGVAHLDVVFGMADVNVGLIYPPLVPYDLIEYLKKKKINLIEVPPDEFRRMACNIIALEPSKVILNAGNSVTRKALEKYGVDVIETDLSEFVKSGGAGHCAVCPLIRDPGPRLEELK
ncbi:MAG: arginine deiminase family protein [Sulfolobales archaeon]